MDAAKYKVFFLNELYNPLKNHFLLLARFCVCLKDENTIYSVPAPNDMWLNVEINKTKIFS